MKQTWIRLSIGAGVLGVTLASTLALATPDLIKKDTSKCSSLKNRVCGSSCEGSVHNYGICLDDQTGQTLDLSIECCCCTDGANHRSWIGG
jgi:hypothetical protein